MSDQKLNLKGWDHDQSNGFQTDKMLEFSYEEPPQYARGAGRVITRHAAHEMVVKKFWSDLVNSSPTDKTIAVSFSKRLLLLILSQQKCEGIRFYFCKRPKDPTNPESEMVNSLVLVGVDENDKDLGATSGKSSIFNEVTPTRSSDPEPTIMEEVGEHLVYSDIEASKRNEDFSGLTDFEVELVQVFQKLSNESGG